MLSAMSDVVKLGALKVQDWKMQDWIIASLWQKGKIQKVEKKNT